ncbi:hypothetical protein J2Z83_002899 [Virgibacillus natechei]|uniref:DUF4145 domain-containing protein n=1 Tax=Virgibacillus natechei TaxID=1216297 RepID=A0ABS4IIQ9_9BACI|nr:DUF4145 domain-containing protein [Virgibacillus natechei]MBP1970763.1 hypothetical protein [Virgibacillus natechei]UZD12329.1 DUF4145 domain-containing protein [Virgibacillus natechei]
MEANEKILTCYHCGNKTSMKSVAEYKYTDDDEIWDYRFSYERPVHVVSLTKWWMMYICPVCKEVTLELATSNSEEFHPSGARIVEEKIIYPTINNDNKYIPNGVSDAFSAALKVKNLDGAICVLALRRTLERMCKHKEAKGKDLFEKLKFLENEKILPPIINEISYILRKEGNSAAHADGVEFDTQTVLLLIDFTKTILDYVYTLPEKINNAQKRLEEMDQQTGSTI